MCCILFVYVCLLVLLVYVLIVQFWFKLVHFNYSIISCLMFVLVLTCIIDWLTSMIGISTNIRQSCRCTGGTNYKRKKEEKHEWKNFHHYSSNSMFEFQNLKTYQQMYIQLEFGFQNRFEWLIVLNSTKLAK